MNFENKYLKIELLQELNKYDIYGINCYDFENIFMNIPNIHAPLRKKYLRANNVPFMNKPQSKAGYKTNFSNLKPGNEESEPGDRMKITIGNEIITNSV